MFAKEHIYVRKSPRSFVLYLLYIHYPFNEKYEHGMPVIYDLTTRFQNYHIFFVNKLPRPLLRSQKMFQWAKKRLKRMFKDKEKKEDGISDGKIMEKNSEHEEVLEIDENDISESDEDKNMSRKEIYETSHEEAVGRTSTLPSNQGLNEEKLQEFTPTSHESSITSNHQSLSMNRIYSMGDLSGHHEGFEFKNRLRSSWPPEAGDHYAAYIQSFTAAAFVVAKEDFESSQEDRENDRFGSNKMFSR